MFLVFVLPRSYESSRLSHLVMILDPLDSSDRHYFLPLRLMSHGNDIFVVDMTWYGGAKDTVSVSSKICLSDHG